MKSIIVVVVALCFVEYAAAECLLCENGANGLKRPYFKVNSAGMNCARKVQKTYSLEADSAECSWEIIQYREMCCGEAEPPEIAQAPTEAPGADIEHTGSYPACDICRDGNFPGNPSMVINMLYIGQGSCRNYFEVGLAGYIITHMCDTLQFFAHEPCGCGLTTANQGNGNGNDGRTPTTSRPISYVSTRRPTPSPTPYPTRRPTPIPTSRPTLPPFYTVSSSRTTAPVSPTQRPNSSSVIFSNNSNGNANNRAPASSPVVRRDPDYDDKDGVDQWDTGNRGGQGGVRGRRLKSSR